jgi:uracil phosphoribosyltransferase
LTRIAIASDHAGFELKQDIVRYLKERGEEVVDLGARSTDSVDYPDYAQAVAHALKDARAERGVLVCGSGIGMDMAANRFPGIRAALVRDLEAAQLCRTHNDANVLCLGSRATEFATAREYLELFLETPFEGGRHRCRVSKIDGQAAPGVTVFDHPLIGHKLLLLRDEGTRPKVFRETIRELASLMAFEITRDIEFQEKTVRTPLGTEATGVTVMGDTLGVVPILRAGLGMVDGILQVLPMAPVGHVGLYRDPDTLEPVDYYCKLPLNCEKRTLIVVDPMLATGGSAGAAVKFLKDKGAGRVKFMCILAAPEGIERLRKEHPDVGIYAAGVDDHLNDHGYIVPGLGDAGDRLYGTK